jgi:membrane protein implicated in regulation of membrane protease activity
VALAGAILLALFVVPSPWGLPVVAAGAAVEVAEAWVMVRWSRRRRSADPFVGARGVALDDGWVRVRGERWRALADEQLAPGTEVEVVAVDGLTVRVRRAP